MSLTLFNAGYNRKKQHLITPTNGIRSKIYNTGY